MLLGVMFAHFHPLSCTVLDRVTFCVSSYVYFVVYPPRLSV